MAQKIKTGKIYCIKALWFGSEMIAVNLQGGGQENHEKWAWSKTQSTSRSIKQGQMPVALGSDSET